LSHHVPLAALFLDLLALLLPMQLGSLLLRLLLLL
jgi:hypothetical protein